MNADRDAHARLAAAVQARILALRPESQAAMQARAGGALSAQTFTYMKLGSSPNGSFRDSQLAGLDLAMRWQRGSARRVFYGEGEPVVEPDSEPKKVSGLEDVDVTYTSGLDLTEQQRAELEEAIRDAVRRTLGEDH